MYSSPTKKNFLFLKNVWNFSITGSIVPVGGDGGGGKGQVGHDGHVGQIEASLHVGHVGQGGVSLHVGQMGQGMSSLQVGHSAHSLHFPKKNNQATISSNTTITARQTSNSFSIRAKIYNFMC
jgi:hypothetical protein